jgi:hypothetical protein
MSWFRRKVRNGIRGTAYVSACGGVPPDMKVAINIGSTYRCPMNLVVQVPGREPYAADISVDVDPNHPVEPGMTLPVTVDANDPQRIEVHVDGIPSNEDRAKAQQQADLDRIRREQADQEPG